MLISVNTSQLSRLIVEVFFCSLLFIDLTLKFGIDTTYSYKDLKIDFFLGANLVQYALEVNALRALDRQTQCSVPDKLCEWSKTTADTESGSVVECLLEAIVVEKDP